jgi:hypothetical protein
MPRYFTLQEANEVLNAIRPFLDEIQKIRKEIIARRPEILPGAMEFVIQMLAAGTLVFSSVFVVSNSLRLRRGKI